MKFMMRLVVFTDLRCCWFFCSTHIHRTSYHKPHSSVSLLLIFVMITVCQAHTLGLLWKFYTAIVRLGMN